MIYNFMISFHKVPVNPKKSMQFVGFGNFTKTLADPSFYSALMVTLLFTVLVVFLSTGPHPPPRTMSYQWSAEWHKTT
mgnify:CR=1 FL=1